MTGTWHVDTEEGAHVRLRSGKVGLVSVDVSAPVSGGELVVDDATAHLTLRLDLQQLRTSNFLLQAAARSLVGRHGARVLAFDGSGPIADAHTATVSGRATAGDVDLPMDLVLTASGPADDAWSRVDLTGAAEVGTVHLPLPGMGTVDDFAFDVEGRLLLDRRD